MGWSRKGGGGEAASRDGRDEQASVEPRVLPFTALPPCRLPGNASQPFVHLACAPHGNTPPALGIDCLRLPTGHVNISARTLGLRYVVPRRHDAQ